MSSLLRKLLAVWSCLVTSSVMMSKVLGKVEKQMIIIALNLVKQMECRGVSSFLK